MSTKKAAIPFVFLLAFFAKAKATTRQVAVVDRNVRDSFRLGNDGCANNVSVCSSSATCLADGLCLCNADTPNFQSPIIQYKSTKNDQDDSYGCVDNVYGRFKSGK